MPGEEKKSEEGNLQGEAAPAPASEAYPQLVVFGAQNDAKVMAAGSGKVVETAPDPEFGYMVRIDHGNNYITIYRYNDLPKIKEGDDVTKGQLLFEVGFASDRVGYQIMYDKEYIDPMDVMEING